MDVRNILSLSGVLLVLGAAGYYWGLGQRGSLTEAEPERRPDYVVTGILTLETDENGQLRRRLQAAELRHYDQPRDSAELDQPVLTLYEQGREAWRVSARRGRSFNQNTEVRLEGDVHAERRDPDALPLTFDTSVLYAYPQQERLATHARVVVQSPQGQLTSQGLEASVKTGELVLSEKVTGNYAPPRR